MTALPSPPTGHPRPTRRATPPNATLAALAPRSLQTGFLLGLVAATITLLILLWMQPVL